MSYGYIDKDDLKQAGLIGLYKATKHYKELINDNFKEESIPEITLLIPILKEQKMDYILQKATELCTLYRWESRYKA